MRLIPKFAAGGHGYAQYFSDFIPGTPYQYAPLLKETSKAAPSSSKKDDGLSEKDLFNMVKDIDGLPNEMHAIIGLLSGLFVSGVLADNPTLMSNIYLRTLELVKNAKRNKTRYDKSLATALANGAMNEACISANGDIYVLGSDGSLRWMSPSDYFSSSGDYTPITVENLLNLRAFESSLCDDQKIFNIAENSMGFESFQKLLSSAIKQLGSTTVLNDLRLPIDVNTALLGIDELTAEGIDYMSLKLSSLTKNSLTLIQNMINYIVSVMPLRARTFAMLKTGIKDGRDAIGQLAFQYLSAGEVREQKTVLTIDPKHIGGSGSGSGNGDDDSKLKSKYWTLVQNGQLGEDCTVRFEEGNGGMSVAGKYIGLTEGMENGDCTLTLYLASSGLGKMLRAPLAIKFGNSIIDSDSYSLFAVDVGRGAERALLPIDPSTGGVDFNVLPDFAEAQKEINTAKHNGVLIDVQAVLEGKGLGWLYTSANGGDIDYSKLGCFIIVHGITHDKARLVDGQTPIELRDANHSDFIQRMKASDMDYQRMRGVTGNHDIDNGRWYDILGLFDTSEDLYSGLIFIPITMNRNSSGAADKLTRTEGQVKALETGYLQREKIGSANEKSTYMH